MQPSQLPVDIDLEDVPTVLPRKIAKLPSATRLDKSIPNKRQRTSSESPEQMFASHVTVIRVDTSHGKTGGAYVLLCKRPEDGLLAGQWEFPASELDSTSADSSEAVSAALPWLDEMNKNISSGFQPIRHVFSHRVHIYHPRIVTLPAVNASQMRDAKNALWQALAEAAGIEPCSSENSCCRNFRWLPVTSLDDEMKSFTSGVRKIWSCVRDDVVAVSESKERIRNARNGRKK